VFETFWQFAAERQEIFFRRLSRTWPPDPPKHSFPSAEAAASGNKELYELFVRPYVEDREAAFVGCWAGTEPGHGSDHVLVGTPEYHNPKVTGELVARAEGDSFVIRGQKSAWVSKARSRRMQRFTSRSNLRARWGWPEECASALTATVQDDERQKCTLGQDEGRADHVNDQLEHRVDVRTERRNVRWEPPKDH
jgi:hypothetical protein